MNIKKLNRFIFEFNRIEGKNPILIILCSIDYIKLYRYLTTQYPNFYYLYNADIKNNNIYYEGIRIISSPEFEDGENAFF